MNCTICKTQFEGDTHSIINKRNELLLTFLKRYKSFTTIQYDSAVDILFSPGGFVLNSNIMSFEDVVKFIEEQLEEISCEALFLYTTKQEWAIEGLIEKLKTCKNFKELVVFCN